jgi:hypothetical protein
VSQNYVASLRLLDDEGRVLAQCDVQPGYGFQPSSGWTAGQWTDDRLALPLPPVVPEANAYPLVVQLYPVADTPVLTMRLGELVWQESNLAFEPNRPSFELPERITPTDARFGDVAALRGYQLSSAGDTFSLTLYWEALAAGEKSYVRFVHLTDPVNGQIVERADGSPVQSDEFPRHGSYPTNQWVAGEIVADPVTLNLEGVPAGSYRLLVGLYSAEDATRRLPVFTDTGDRLSTGAFPLPDPLLIGE